ncbi:hypothetical protein ACP4OV_014582 [Aristida adscensionis]
MEVLISAVAGDLTSRFISFIVDNYCNHARNEDDHRRLERVLLRMHTVVEEAERRCVTNQGMLLQLKMLIEGMYVGYYMLDRLKFQLVEEDRVEGEVSHQDQSFSMSTFVTAHKRFRFAFPATKKTPLAFGAWSAAKLKDVLQSLEAKIPDMREFFMLLGSCPRLSRQPYSTYLFMEKCMFGRQIEKEQVINFLLCSDTHDCSNLDILPIIGPLRVGKITLVQHACMDQRVRNCFRHTLFLKGDDLRNSDFAVNLIADSGKSLFVIEFSWDVDRVAWTNFKSYLQELAFSGSKIILIGRTQEVATFGTAIPIWMKSLSQEAYWYYFKALAFGSMDPDEHPRLASLSMQLAYELKGSFLGANIVGGMLRANPNAQFWRHILSGLRALVQENLLSFGEHPEDLIDRNFPVDHSKLGFLGNEGQGYLVKDLREADPGQSELPLLTTQELLMGGKIPAEEKFDVLVWKSHIPPYCDYIATYVKQKAQCMVGKKRRLTPGN